MPAQGDQKPQLLIVDDDPAVVQFIHDALVDKYRIETAMTGIDALMQAQTGQPDLILLDIDMGDIDGYAVCQKLKTFETTKRIPVIFISSAFGTLDRLKAFQSGGVDFITKPIEVAELDARVNTHLTIYSLQIDLEKKIHDRTKELVAKQALLQRTNKKQRALLKSLKESEDRYRTFIEAANDGICIIKDGRFVECNSRMLKMLKVKHRQIVGKSPAHFAPQTQPDETASAQMAEQKLQVAEQGNPQIFDWQHQDTAGRMLRTEICLNATRIKDDTYILAIIRDVTQRKAMEQTIGEQTAVATQAIKRQIDDVQLTTSDTVTEIDQIAKVIHGVNEIVSTIASAVEEQSAATKDIADNITQASHGIQEVNVNVSESSNAAADITSHIAEVRTAAEEMANSSSQVEISAQDLEKMAAELNAIVDRFAID